MGTRIIKELTRRHLIKEVKSVANRSRKVYMAYDMEPAREVTGGFGYRDGEFASNWIEQLRKRAHEFLEQRQGQGYSSLQEIHGHLVQTPGPSMPSEDDVQAIMRTLELDEAVYSVPQQGELFYAVRNTSFDIFTGRLPKFLTRTRAEEP